MRRISTRNKMPLCLILALLSFQFSFANTFYVSTTGNDTSGDGSSTNPWKTLRYAVTKVAANQGHVIQLGAGTFVETGLSEVPLGVSILGAGIDVTIIKAASSFYYHPADPGYATDKFLISLSGFNQLDGNQSLKNFTIDGDSKQLHGGIYVRYRNKVVIDGVKVQNTNFSGIWLWDVKDTQLTNSQLVNCSWGSTGYCSGALNLGNLERVEIAQLNVDENTGYGVKAIGPDGYNDIFYLKIHDSHVSVTPFGLWNNGSAPNIAIELWMSTLVGCELYNNYVDNTISLVNSAIPSTGIQTIRVHDNTLDMVTRANGSGYGIELSIHDAEIDHNYFIKGNYGIANWDNPMQNWNIHHNTFYAIQGIYPGEVVRSQWSGLHNVKLYNNTIEFASDKTMNVVGLYGGSSDNLDIKNNLVINSNTSYNYYPNQLIHTEPGATITNLQVLNNSTSNLDPGSIINSILGLLTPNPLVKVLTLTNPAVTKTGTRPTPYYIPSAGSSLIDAGINVGYAYLGSAPDIGAIESGSSSNTPPVVTLTSPINNASFAASASVSIAANATDSDGTISKVEFFQGTTKLGEDLTSPYTFSWTAVPAGNYSLTAKATDNLSASTTSSSIAITVTTNTPPVVSLTSPVNNATFAAGASVSLAANATDSDGTISKVEFFQGTTKLGEDLTSPYTFSWTTVPAGNYSLTAKATDNLSAVTASAAIAIAVTTTGNAPPIVSLTSPVNNATIVAGTTVSLAASASDSDGTINKVEFFQGTTKLGEDSTSPYAFSWPGVPAGSYSLTAKATDNLGGASTSSAISIVVSANIPPAVVLTSPVNNGAFDAGTSVALAASATDHDGTITKVEFFQGTTKLGQDTTIPYAFSWKNVPAGSYSLTAKATDNLKAVTTSSPIVIVVNAVNTPPVVSLTSPVNNATSVTGTSVSIAATATDSDGTISLVEFFQGATKLGEDLSSPYNIAWSPSVAGNYLITAKATDNTGATTVSAGATIAVSDPTSGLQLGLNAFDAALSGGMTLTSDPTALSGSYFSVPLGYGQNYYIPPPASATFNFQLTNTGAYYVWSRVKSPTADNQGYYIYDGRGNWFNWQAGIHAAWSWVRISDSSTGATSTFSFSQGTNELQMAWNDENVQIDRILVTNDFNFVPTDPSGNQITVFPNPIVDTFTIQYTSSVAQQAQVSVFDLGGTLIKQIMVSLNPGLNNVLVDTNYIYNGIYNLVFTPAHGSMATARIVISR